MALEKQQRDYESHNKSSASNDIYIDSEELLRNNKCKHRKDGKFMLYEPYIVLDITENVLVRLKRKKDKELKKNITRHR